jgi:hypothetical protein
MGEKAKNAIMGIMKSDDMRAYFEEMLKGQTSEIIAAFTAKEEDGFVEEIHKLKEKLEKEQEQGRILLLKNRELKTARDRFEESYEDKKRACEKLQQEKIVVEERATILQKQSEQFDSKIKEQKEQADRELQIVMSEKDSAINKLKDYEDKYSCISVAYSNYKSLPESVKQRMSNIFIRDSIYSFIVAVSDWNSIEGIWSFTKRRIIEDETEGLRELVDLFVNSFILYSKIDGSGKYELISPKLGERFDSDKHSIKGIKTDGQIQDVLLEGIFDNTTQKAVFKAVVQIQ